MSSTLDFPPPPHLPDAGSRRTINRLKRGRGQLTALIAAVESGADCRNVVTQLSAVRGALDKAGFELISAAMRECLTEPADAPTAVGVQPGLVVQKPTLAEVRTLFLRLT